MSIWTEQNVEALHRVLVESINEGVVILNPDGRIACGNSRFSQMVNRPMEQILNAPWQGFFAPGDRRQFDTLLQEGRAAGGRSELSLLRSDGSPLAVEVSIRGFEFHEEQSVFVLITDISGRKSKEAERKRLGNLNTGRNRLLEMVADGASLDSILNSLTLFVEEQTEKVLCAILLLDKDGQHLRLGAAPSLSETLLQKLDGKSIGPQAGCCGTAAFRGEPVIVTDTLVDPLYVEGRELAIAHGIRACWAKPIFSHENRLLGTITMFYHQTRGPNAAEVELGQIASHVARLAIEHERAERALRESEERYRALHRDNPTMIFTIDAQGTIISANPFATTRLGFPGGELEGSPILRIVFEDDRPAFNQQLDNCLRNPHEVYRWQFRKVRKDGTLLWVEELAQRIQGVGGQPNILIVCQDITQRKRTEEKLQSTLERLNLAQQAAHVCVWDWDMVTGERLWTREFEAICGLPPTSYDNMYEAWTKVVHPDDLARVQEYLDRSLREHRQEVQGDYRIIRPDGQERWLTFRGICNYDSEGRPTRLIGTLADITDRKRAEEALQHAKDYAEHLIQFANVIIVSLDREANILGVNKMVERWTGYTQAELLGRNWFDTVVPASHYPYVQDEFLRLLSGGEPRDFENPIVAKSGEERVITWRNNQIREQDRVIGAQAFGIDITDLRQAEEALRRSEERFRTMADSVPEIIFTCAPDGTNEYKNQRFYEYTGLPAEPMGWRWLQLVHPDDRARVKNSWDEAVNNGHAFELQFRLRAANGDYRWFLSRARAVRDSNGKILQWQGTCTDIDSQKRAEELLEEQVALRTAKLQQTVGELEQYSYSITHDLRAPLRAIQGYAQMLKEESAGRLPDSCEDFLQRIMASTQRMENLIRDSLNYGKLLQTEIKLEPIDAALLIREIIQSYPFLQEPQAEVKLEGDFPLVMGNDAGLSQCVSNLLRNAVKFVANGTKPRVRIWAESRDEWVRLWFEDNGIGIAKELQEVIFGIFQQLDKGYEGSGIGLAIVRKAMERMGGKVGVESEPGQGSRFWLDLKRAVEQG